MNNLIKKIIPSFQKLKLPKKKKEKRKKLFMSMGTKFSIKEQTHFAKRLSFLINAGVPIMESISILKDQTKSKSKSVVFDVLINDIANGKFLHVGLTRSGKLFGDFAINIIKVGEMGGILSKNLEYLAGELKKKQELRRKVIGSMMYPIFITIATLGLTGMLTVFIFPKVMPIFLSLNVELPLTTRTLLALSDYLRTYGIHTIVGIIIFIGIFISLYKKIYPFRFIVDSTFTKIPLFGKIAKNYYMANFCRTLGLMLRSGITVVDAISITADTIENRVYRKECKLLSESVTAGGKISTYLSKRKKLFPDMVGHMIAIGEKSGSLPETLLYLSDMYEGEVDDLTKNLSNVIEPILMVFMGIIVGFVAISVITPIYEITQKLTP